MYVGELVDLGEMMVSEGLLTAIGGKGPAGIKMVGKNVAVVAVGVGH